MKHVVYFPCFWEFQFVGYWSQNFVDFKGSFSFWCNFLVVRCFQIACVEPYFLSFDKWRECICLSCCDSRSSQFVCSQCFFQYFTLPHVVRADSESSPSQTLFSILLRLCSDSARTVLGLC